MHAIDPCLWRTLFDVLAELFMREHFELYGLRVHLVVSGRGEPVEFALAAASEADVKLLKELGLEICQKARSFTPTRATPTTTTRTC